MASKSETGHAINMANFKVIIDACTTYGAVYNPANANLSIANMTALWTTANTAHSQMQSTIAAAKPQLNAREILFEPLNGLVTRAIGLLNSTEASKQFKKDAKGYADKIRGFGLRRKKTTAAATKDAETKEPEAVKDNAPAAEALTDPDFVSKSHLSYVQRADNFKALVELLKNEPGYTPNEADLKTTALTTMYNNLKAANDGIGAILKGVDKSRITRDKALYAPGSGIVDISLKCKDYVKGIFGAGSAEFKMVRGISLYTPKEKK